MAIDFQQLYKQVKQFGETANQREMELQTRRELASELLQQHATDLDGLRERVERVVRSIDPSLRCALPQLEPLDAHFPPPSLPAQATLLAADGSQISPDRHAEVDYYLINVGAIQMRLGLSDPPQTITECNLYDSQTNSPTGVITEAVLALQRDLREREMLARIAAQAAPPVVTFTDGPMELWGAKESEGEAAAEYQDSLRKYLEVLRQLNEMRVITAGYVDKPSANLVMRLLEVALLPESALPDIRKKHPLQGVTDLGLYRGLLPEGERSAVFKIQSQSAKNYPGELALHFFYLNLGRPGHPWLARVEIPAWVAHDYGMLNSLHAALIEQCRLMGNRPYPYLLNRAHEVALVSLQEKEQVTQMIIMELRRRGLPVGEKSYKQASKDLPGRTGYKKK